MTGDRVLICGVDEAGRGPLAGPVFAAAVILDPVRPIAGLADSKMLTARRRELHFQDDRRRQQQGDAGQQLIGDAEERPERVDAAERIAHALDQKISPTGDDQQAREHVRLNAPVIAERFPEVTVEILR
mgnify:CR=1 FL=1